MTRSLFLRFPDVPKSRTRLPTRRSNAMAVLHRGQYVTVTGTPPMSSLTISCDIRIARGNARASPLISTLMTGSFSLMYDGGSATSMYLGLSIGGMPSRGGPPDMISSNGTECLEKSVFQPPVRNRGGSSLRRSSGSLTTGSDSSSMGALPSSFGGSVDGTGARDDPTVSLDGDGTG